MLFSARLSEMVPSTCALFRLTYLYNASVAMRAIVLSSKENPLQLHYISLRMNVSEPPTDGLFFSDTPNKQPNRYVSVLPATNSSHNKTHYQAAVPLKDTQGNQSLIHKDKNECI